LTSRIHGVFLLLGSDIPGRLDLGVTQGAVLSRSRDCWEHRIHRKGSDGGRRLANSRRTRARANQTSLATTSMRTASSRIPRKTYVGPSHGARHSMSNSENATHGTTKASATTDQTPQTNVLGSRLPDLDVVTKLPHSIVRHQVVASAEGAHHRDPPG
jgi:hypothetical protein